MTTHSSASGSAPAARLLDQLIGQWVEETSVEADGRTRLVTSRGFELTTGDAGILGREVRHRDSTVIGQIVTTTRIDTDGSMGWALLRPEGQALVELTISAPWVLRGLQGEGLAATAVGQIGHRPPSGPLVATAEALAAWAERPRSAIDLQLLASAEDDWLQIADVVSALVNAGVVDDEKILRRGVDLVAGLLARGDLVAGMITDGGFVASPEALPELVERIATTWAALGGRGVSLGSICWLDITDAGRAALHTATRPPAAEA